VNKNIKTNRDIYMFTITNGFTVHHANVVVKKLIKEKIIKKITTKLSYKLCKPGVELTIIEVL